MSNEDVHMAVEESMTELVSQLLWVAGTFPSHVQRFLECINATVVRLRSAKQSLVFLDFSLFKNAFQFYL